MIWLTSDLHLGHDREFIWGARGFESVQEMNDMIICNWNFWIKPTDEVYCLGDLTLGDHNKGIEIVSRLNGKIHLIRGNHDTDARIALYQTIPSIVEICDAKYLKYGKYHFYMTHFPCLTGNLQKESLTQMTLGLHGHTHSTKKFFYDLPYCYNVGVDSHNCSPVSIDEIIDDMKAKVEECKSLL